MRRLSLPMLLLTLAPLPLLAAAAPNTTTATAAAPTAAEPEAPKTIPSFDLTAIDKSVDPCTDFYQYACGGWKAKNPVPADQPSWTRFAELAEHNRRVLRTILDRVAQPTPGRSALEQQIGDFYASCMDEAAVNAAGAKPIEADLQRIAAISSVPQLVDELARLHGNGVNAVFGFGQQPDFHDAKTSIAVLGQGGLGLPNKDYYTKTDAKSVETRQRYEEYAAKMLALLGDTPEQAAAGAKAAFDIENQLAGPSLGPVERRDPAKQDHPMTRAEAAKLMPALDLPRYLTALDAPAFDHLNVQNPAFFTQLNTMLGSVPLAAWKSYLRLHLASDSAPYLSQPFVEERFRFYDQFLGGQKELQERWKRCVRTTDGELGEAVGQLYVEKAFPPDAKQRTLTMVGAIEHAMGADLQTLPWMSDATKKAAAAKLAQVTNKIGYPDKWRDYSTVKIVRGDHVGNVLRAEQFEYRRQLAKIGKPVDRAEWGMTPPTVNAYYSPLQNNINFPAGILQPPFYDNSLDDAVNFGGVGAVIGHELTHGFDDQGAKFDGDGNLRDWWTKDDEAKFKERTECIASEYDQFIAVDDVHINGHLTLGENTADNGGLRLAHMALEEAMKSHPLGTVSGYTPEQRFFLQYGQVWCQNLTPENARLRALSDPHAQNRYRVDGVLRNMPEFAQAFQCKPDAAMVSKNACRVW